MKTKISYLNGSRLFAAFVAGGNAVIRGHSYLNKINVFPVADADTGTNLASTMRAIAQGAKAQLSIRETLQSMAAAALSGAQGNSGLIFAQFLHGMSREVENTPRLTTRTFAESVRRAVTHAHKAIASPVEGTMITVIRDWADSLYRRRHSTADFAELMSASIVDARQSLRDTPRKLDVLARAGVVDAGAKGFVDFLEGVLHFIRKGRLSRIPDEGIVWAPEETKAPAREKSLHNRYCAEALLTGTALDPDRIREIVSRFGDSAVVAGSGERVRFHVHTNDPSGLFAEIRDAGAIAQIKVDDMRKQYEAVWLPKARTALAVDSACDLPSSVIDERQIHVIPYQVTLGGQAFLDRITLTPDQCYAFLENGKTPPKTSQPTIKNVQNVLSYLAGHYESVIVLTLADKLSGTCRTCRAAAAALAGKKVSVIDGRNASVGLGLLAARASEMILAGRTHEDVVAALESWIPRTKTYIDVQTMKYLVRSGRVGRIKGWIGRALNVKPVISVDAEGRIEAIGRSFSRAGNMDGIIEKIESRSRTRRVWGYALVHVRNPERAALYAEKLTAALGRPPEYTMDASPALGIHAGIGAVGVAVSDE